MPGQVAVALADGAILLLDAETLGERDRVDRADGALLASGHPDDAIRPRSVAGTDSTRDRR